MSKQHKNGQARIFLKQSLYNIDYLFYTFIIFSHFCSIYPFLTKSKNKIGNVHFGVCMVTRSLTCFTEIYNCFYINNTKVVPIDIYNIITIESLAH